MRFLFPFISALATLASAYTHPDYNKPPSGNPILLPSLGEQVHTGAPYTISWTPTTPGKVSLVLLRGPSTNLIPIATLADGISNSGKYVWTPDNLLQPDVRHYALQLVVEGTGQYQWSTQFGISNPGYIAPTTTAGATTTDAGATTTTAGAPTTASDATSAFTSDVSSASTSTGTATHAATTTGTATGTTTGIATGTTTGASGTTTASAPSTTFSTSTKSSFTTGSGASNSASVTIKPSGAPGSANRSGTPGFASASASASASALPSPQGLLPLPNAAGRKSVSVGGVVAVVVAAVAL